MKVRRKNQYDRVLRVVRQGPATSGEVALETGLERRACSAILTRLWKRGRVERSEKMIARARGPGAYLYTSRARRKPGETRLNVFSDDAAVIAQEVKARMLRSRVSHTVYVDRSGKVILDRTHDPRRGLVPPEWLVGTYTPAQASPELIAEDLQARREELAA